MTTNEFITLLQKVGIKIVRVGNNNLHALCPNHQEIRPSWGISTLPPYLHGCFSCGYKGNLLTLLLDRGWSLSRIKNELGEKFDKQTPELTFVKKASSKSKVVPIDEKNRWPYTLDQPAIDYLRKRFI